MKEPIGRIDTSPELREALLPYCRLRRGGRRVDPEGRHTVAVADACEPEEISSMLGNDRKGP